MGRDLRQNKTPKNIPIRVAVVLFCLTLLSVYLVTGLFARYTTTAQSSDQARVAAFSIQSGIQDGDTQSKTVRTEIVPGAAQEVNIVIHNKSEVAVEYTVKVAKKTDNLPLTLKLEKVGDVPDPTSAENENANAFTVQQIPGDHTDTYQLTITWPKSENTENDLALMGMVDHVMVTVTATQID